MNHDQCYIILSDVYGDMIYTLLLIPRGGTPGNSCLGVCHLVLQILILFQTKKWHFPQPFSEQISRIHTHFQTWPNFACSRLSDSGRDAPVSSRIIFMFALSQFSGPNYLRASNRSGLIRQKLCYHYQIRAQTKKFFQCFSNLHSFISFSFIWNCNDKDVHACMLP